MNGHARALIAQALHEVALLRRQGCDAATLRCILNGIRIYRHNRTR